jgi:hypothetical protein
MLVAACEAVDASSSSEPLHTPPPDLGTEAFTSCSMYGKPVLWIRTQIRIGSGPPPAALPVLWIRIQIQIQWRPWIRTGPDPGGQK